MRRGFTRRQFIKITSAGAAVLALPWSLEACSDGDGRARYFTEGERAALDALTSRILPTDSDPGAHEAGVVDYIETLLTAFEYDPPLIFAGGPFSGRQPRPDNQSGTPSDSYPKDSFEHFIRLSRVKEIAWKVRIYGSANVNDAENVVETKGYRDVYRDGLGALDAKSREVFQNDFVALTPEQQDEVIKNADQPFITQVVEHTMEGSFATPEYGGNADLAGWTWTAFDGDSQPLGFSIYNETTDSYDELPNKPLSEENPDEDFSGLTGDVLEFIETIAVGQGGTRFF